MEVGMSVHAVKSQIPKPKLQINFKFQMPNDAGLGWSLVVGICLELGVWDLEFFARTFAPLSGHSPIDVFALLEYNAGTRRARS
jgi:hypothetical protein